MKLLCDFIRLRAVGRWLLSGRCDVQGRNFAVTVPQPLHGASVSYLPLPVAERSAQPVAPSPPLRLASGR